MPSYHSSTTIRDWSNCQLCPLHASRTNVAVRRSGYVYNGNIINDPPLPGQYTTATRTNQQEPTETNRNQQQQNTGTDQRTSENHRTTSWNIREPPSQTQQQQGDLLSHSKDIGGSQHLNRSTNNPSHPTTNTPEHSDNSSICKRLLFIGEAPGESEDREGIPFIGASYQPLNTVFKEATAQHPGIHSFPQPIPCLTPNFHTAPITLQPVSTPTHIGFTAKQPYYTSPCNQCPACRENKILEELRHKYGPRSFHFTITNTVCCRPPNNREPEIHEQYLCQSHLVELLPHEYNLVVCLGDVAEKYYKPLQSQHSWPPYIKLLHPAFILRQKYKTHLLREQGLKLKKYL